mgnify:FL=1
MVGTGGIQHCYTARDLGFTGGIQPCENHRDHSDLDYYKPSNLSNEHLTLSNLYLIIEKLATQGQNYKKGDLNVKTNKDYFEHCAIKVNNLVDKLFVGSQFYKKEMHFIFERFYFNNIPGFPEIELASIHIADNAWKIITTLTNIGKEFHSKRKKKSQSNSIFDQEIHDISLDIILKNSKNDDDNRFNKKNYRIRVPFLKKDGLYRVPTKHKSKHGNIFVLEPREKHGKSYNTVHHNSYSSERNLIKGLKLAIKKYSEMEVK